VEATVCAHADAASVIVVDEADGFLNTNYVFRGGWERTSVTKSWLNDFLDRTRVRMIWITNDIEFMEESTLRRFAYAVRFRRQSTRQREQVWRTHLQASPLRAYLDDDTVRSFSRDFQVSAADIGSALAVAPTVLRDRSRGPDVVRETVRELLASHERIAAHRGAPAGSPLPDHYELDVLNTDVPISSLLPAVEGYLAEPNGRTRPPMNLLFWGLPGTGKTAFVRHMARALGQELLIRRASDLLCKWVGETEHNIRDAFEEADQEGAILLLDEADSFLADRRFSHHTWETSQTNEFLTQMENHHGLLICCTNLLDRLDPASLRRFAWKVKFLPLTAEGRTRLYGRCFVITGPLSDECLRRLHSIPSLTPGDFRAVWERHRYAQNVALCHDDLIRALEEEARLQHKVTPISGFGTL